MNWAGSRLRRNRLARSFRSWWSSRSNRLDLAAAGGSVIWLSVCAPKERMSYNSFQGTLLLKELGVEQIIAYTEEKVSEVCQDVDFVLDLVGGEAGLETFACLKKSGVLVTVPTITRDQVM